MTVQSSRQAKSSKPPFPSRDVLPPSKRIQKDAERIETLLRQVLYESMGEQDSWETRASEFPQLKSLNNFSKQIITRMFRSNPAFQGFRIEFPEPVLKAHALFLLGTLCSDFDYLHTSPLQGLNILEVGCGALSSYWTSSQDERGLVEKFYGDNPPILAEILQMLGAQVTGIDPRVSDKETYEYQTSYKHRVMEFGDIPQWLTTVNTPFDVITCFNLFHKSNFAYYYSAPHEISAFLKSLKRSLSPRGLIYCSAPFIPSSEENKQLNVQVLKGAGFRVIYQGYDWILRPA